MSPGNGRTPGEGEASYVSDFLRRAVDGAPDRVAVIDEGGTTTYRELFDESERLAARFASAGISRGDGVGLWLPNSSFWLAAHIALGRIGALAVGINSRYPVAETARIADAANLRAVIVDIESSGVADRETVRALIESAAVPIATIFSRSRKFAVPSSSSCIDLAEELDSAGSAVRSPADVGEPARAEDGFAVFTSSGSTGRPKLIVHSQQGICAHSESVARSLGYDAPQTVVLGQLPMCGVWGFNTVYAAIAAMATVVTMERFDPSKAVQLIARNAVTTANGPDLFVRHLFNAAEAEHADISTLRSLGFSTFSNDSLELVEWGDSLGVSLFQVYGSSEQQALMVHQPVYALPTRRAEPGGKVSNADTSVRVRDTETGELVIDGRPGMLESFGPNVMIGYLVDGSIDRSAFTSDGWVRTGDICQSSSSGIRYLSRDKDVLRLSGFLVDPHEIEIEIEKFEGVLEAKVVGIDTKKGPGCVAFVRTADPDGFDAGECLSRCRTELASYKVPAAIYALAEYPRVDGANGPRIQRLALRDLALSKGHVAQ